MGYSFEVILKLVEKAKSDECFFPDVADDFLKCEFYLDGGCGLINKLYCELIGDEDRREIEYILRSSSDEK